MKKIILLIGILLFSLHSFSQGYAGIIIDNNATLASVRPYINARLTENDFNFASFYPVVGAGMNSLGNISASVGFDLVRSINKNETVNAVAGFSLEILGWQEVYQEYLPSFRVGIETKKFIILGITNQKFETFVLDGIKGFHPSLRPTVGIFYKIR